MAKSKHIVPLFDTTNPDHLRENMAAADVKLSSQEIIDLEKNLPDVKGERYGTSSMKNYRLDE